MVTQDIKITAAAIRKALKAAFGKGHGISVTIDRFSMGSSAVVSWKEGLSRNSVEAVVNKTIKEFADKGIQVTDDRMTFIRCARSIPEQTFKLAEIAVQKEHPELQAFELDTLVWKTLAETSF